MTPFTEKATYVWLHQQSEDFCKCQWHGMQRANAKCSKVCSEIQISCSLSEYTCRIQHPDTLRASRVGAAHGSGGGSGLDRTAHRWVDPARRRPFLLLSSASRNLSWTSLRKQEQMKTYLNRWKNEINSWPAVDARLIRGRWAGPRAFFGPVCWPVYRRLFVFANPFHARHVRDLF